MIGVLGHESAMLRLYWAVDTLGRQMYKEAGNINMHQLHKLCSDNKQTVKDGKKRKKRDRERIWRCVFLLTSVYSIYFRPHRTKHIQVHAHYHKSLLLCPSHETLHAPPICTVKFSRNALVFSGKMF